MFQHFSDLTGHILRKNQVRQVAVAGSAADHVLEAVIMAARQGIAMPLLFGDKQKTLALLEALGAPELAGQIRDCASPEDAVAGAIAAVHTGQAGFIMKGLVETATLMRALLQRENGFRRGDAIVSSACFAEIETHHKLVVLTDGAVTPAPTLEQKKRILESTVGAMQRMGWTRPKVAVLAAVEKLNPKMPGTVDADALKQMYLRGEITGCAVEGPISFDLAMDKDSARLKGFGSEVAGEADLLLFPDIASANICIKTLTVTGRNKTGSVILGLRTPIVMSSRGSTAENKYRSLLLAASMI